MRLFPDPSVVVSRPLLLTAALLAGTGLTGCARLAAQAPAPQPPRVVATGLNGPQGVAVAADGTVWVTDDGTGGATTFTAPARGGGTASGNYGDTARVIRVTPDGVQSVVTSTPSISPPMIGPTGGGKLALIGSNVYLTNGVWNAGWSGTRPAKASSVLKIDGAATSEVANIYAFEASTNPDGVPAAQGGIDSHAYGLGAGPDGLLYVADAGANAVFTVDPASGAVSLVAALQGRTGTGVQSVPTGVVALQDGSVYVSLLSGFPFTAGAARVVKVVGGTVSDFATGLTLLTDLKRGPDGRLYAVSLGQSDVTAPLPYVPNTGSVVRLGAAGEKEVVLSGLNYPTSLAFAANGDAYVTENGVGAPGTGRVMRYSQLTRYAAQ